MTRVPCPCGADAPVGRACECGRLRTTEDYERFLDRHQRYGVPEEPTRGRR